MHVECFMLGNNFASRCNNRQVMARETRNNNGQVLGVFTFRAFYNENCKNSTRAAATAMVQVTPCNQ